MDATGPLSEKEIRASKDFLLNLNPELPALTEQLNEFPEGAPLDEVRDCIRELYEPQDNAKSEQSYRRLNTLEVRRILKKNMSIENMSQLDCAQITHEGIMPYIVPMIPAIGVYLPPKRKFVIPTPKRDRCFINLKWSPTAIEKILAYSSSHDVKPITNPAMSDLVQGAIALLAVPDIDFKPSVMQVHHINHRLDDRVGSVIPLTKEEHDLVDGCNARDVWHILYTKKIDIHGLEEQVQKKIAAHQAKFPTYWGGTQRD